MVFDRLILLRGRPAVNLLLSFPASLSLAGFFMLAVFATDTRAPSQVIVHLDEVVIPQHRLIGLDPAEEIHHALLELGLEAWNVARGVDFGEGHAEFVDQAPETGEEDGAAEEVVLAVWLLEHDCEVVLDEEDAEGYGICCQWLLHGDGLVVPEVVDSGWGSFVEGWVALREVVAELFKKLEGAIIGFWGCHAAFVSALGDAAGFVGMKTGELVVEFDPVVPLHGTKAHGNVVRAVLEGTVGQRFGRMNVPVRIRSCCGTFEIHGIPNAGWTIASFEGASSS